MNLLLITDNGYPALINNDSDQSLRALQQLVDGYVDYLSADPVALGFNADVWFNDEALYREDFSINLIGSFITGRQLVGPVVIALSDGPVTTGLTSAHLEQLRMDGMYIDDNGGKGWTVDEAVHFFIEDVASV